MIEWFKSFDQRKLLIRLLAFLILFNFGWNYAQERVGVDFYNYWLASKILADGGVRQFYDGPSYPALALKYFRAAREEGGRRLAAAQFWSPSIGTSSTPLFYAITGLFWSGDYESDYRRLQNISLVLFFLAIVVLSRICGYETGVVELGIAGAMTQFQPFLLDIKVCNVNRIIFAWLVFYLVVSRGARESPMRQVLGASLLVGAFLFKPILVFVVLLIAWTRIVRCRWKQLGFEVLGAAVAVIIAIIAAILKFGSAFVWVEWLEMGGYVFNNTPVSKGNWGLVPLYRELWGFDLSSYAAPCFLALSAVSLWLRARFLKIEREPEDLLALSLGLLTYMLSARLCWSHYYTLALIPLLLILRPELEQSKIWRAIRLGVGLLAGLLLSAKPVDDWLNLAIHESWGVYMCCGSFVLFILVLTETLKSNTAIAARNISSSLTKSRSDCQVAKDRPLGDGKIGHP